MRYIIVPYLFFLPFLSYSQAGFTADAGEGCRGTSISFDNASVNATSYEWDFCLGDFAVAMPAEESESISGMSDGYGYEVVEDGGVWYSFIVGKRTNSLFRLTHGDSPLNAPSQVDNLGGFGLLSAPEGLDIIKFNGNWHGVVGGFNNGSKLTRLDFPDGLGGTVTGTDLGDFGATLVRMRDVHLVNESGSLALVFTVYNTNRIYRIDYGSSFDNTIDAGTDIYSSVISNLTYITGIDFQYVNGNYLVHALSISSENVVRLNFGSSLLNVPAEEAVYAVSGLANGYRIKLIEEAGSYYGLIGSTSQSLRVFDFGSLGSAQTPAEITYSSPLSTYVAYEPIRYAGSTYIQGTSGFSFKRLSFEADCSASLGYSTDFEPADVSYGTSGTKEIWLRGIDSDGDVSGATGSVTISSNQAPTFEVRTSNNVCVSNSQDFSVTDISAPEDAVIGYQWDFNGDDVIDLTQSDPDFGTASVDYSDYGGAGSYTLSVTGTNDGGCSNQVFLEVTLYDPPTTPVDLTVTGSLCTFNELSFSYAELASLPDEASLIWGFDGEETSTEDTPLYTFETSGDKEITLQVVLPNCTTSVFTRTISIAEGPSASFTYTNNCFGEAIQFTNQSGEGISYTWDFGDGSPVETNSVSFDPVHTYSAAGTYTISLQVENASGCVTTYTQGLEVTDQPLVDFSTGTAEENLPVQFTGIDQTLDDNSVTSWLWDFASLGSSTDQNPTFTFSAVGNHEVTLTAVTAQGCEESISKTVTVEEAEFPTASFTADAGDGCLGTSISLDNASVNATSYEWDFCLGDFAVALPAEESESIFEMSDGYGYEVVEDDGVWYSFIVGKNTNSLFRLTHGDSPLNAPSQVENLGGFGLLSAPEGLDIIKYNGNWHGVVGGFNNGSKLTRLDFPAGLGGTVTGTDLGDFGATLVRMRDVHLVNESGNLALVFTVYNTNRIYRIDYGSSFDNTIDAGTDIYSSAISNLTYITGIDIQYVNGNYLVHALSISSENVVRLNFGSSLLNAPTEEAVYAVSGLTNGYRIKLIEEAGSYYGLIGSTTQSARVFDFGGLGSAQTPAEITYSSPLSTYIAYEPIRYAGSTYIPGTSGSAFKRLSFEADCEISIGYSTDFEPTGVSYSTSGTKEIWLRGIDADGDIAVAVETVTVTENQIPDIDFTIDANRCIANQNTFTSSSPSDNITSYSWDFDGDGIVDSTEPNPTFQYSTPGTYDILLDVVSTNGCHNYTEEQITIYPEPPAPSFDVEGARCNETELTFSNTTDGTGYGDALTYSWDFNGEGSSVQEDTVFTFEESGSKSIELVASIPGCSSTVTQVIDLNTGPDVDFTWTNNCFGDYVQFQNLASGTGITAYSWDFGDGFISTVAEPEHLYEETGTYEVALTVSNETGCFTTFSKQLIVDALPDPYFEYDLACEGQEVVLRDMSEVNGSKIVAWEWYIDSESVPVSQESTAEVLLESVESEVIRLVVYAANGCEASLTRSVDILKMPEVSFSSEVTCLGETSSFIDQTDEEQVGNRSWFVNGHLVQDNTSAQFDSAFFAPGSYEIELVVNSQNFCSGSYSETIEVLSLPELDFEIVGECSGEVISVKDLSVNSTDPVVSRTWYLNDAEVGNGLNALLPIAEGGNYEVSLSAVTENGCLITESRFVDVFPKPLVHFEASNDYGVPPFDILFENQTENATDYAWYVNDKLISTKENPVLSFADEGMQLVKLVAENEQGCADSMSIEINSASPQIDISLHKMQLIENGGSHKILLDIGNYSNIPLERLQATIRLENDFEITETILQRINVNEQSVVSLNPGFSLSAGNLSYLCVTLSSFYQEEDQTPGNNENCVSIQPKATVELPFPNPSSDRITVRAVFPISGDVGVAIIDMAGQVRHRERLKALPKGLNTFVIDLLKLNAGTYFLKIDYKGGTYKTRIIKQ